MPYYIQTNLSEYPKIETAQMIEVDRLMIQEYRIGLLQMMENAGRCLAILVKERFFDGDVAGKSIFVMAGTGGNGGGALVAARRLHNWGAKVTVYTTAKEQRYSPVTLHQYQILKRIGVPIHHAEIPSNITNVAAILDGIIGYRLQGNPKGKAAEFIRWMNAQEVPIIALDTPSGLSLTSGKLNKPTVRATATLTLALPKKGLFEERAKDVVGELYLGDISVPMELYKEMDLGMNTQNIFRYSDIVRVL